MKDDKSRVVRSEFDKIRSLKAARERWKRLDALVAEVTDLRTNFVELTNRVEQMANTLRELTRANNAASVVLSCVERHLDETSSGWDDGARAEVEMRAKLLRERAELVRAANVPNLSSKDRVKLGRRMWEVAKELGTEAVDVPSVLATYLQARDLDASKSFVDEVRSSGLRISSEVEEILVRLEKRIEELGEGR